MGSPKAARSKAGQGGIWRRRVSAPFVVVLVAAVLVLVAFTGQFVQGPDASSRFTPVHVEDSIPRRTPTDQGLETSDSSRQEGEGSDQKAKPDESPDEAIREQQQPPEDTTEYSGKESALQVQENEEDIVKEAGSAPYTKCTPPSSTTVCDLSNLRFDICELCGDARTIGQSSTVMYVPHTQISDGEEWSIRAQSRKNLPWIKKVTVKSLNTSQPAPRCTSKHAMPAIVFALGGLTANVWHDFSDVLVPLFLTAREFDGDVQFLITNNQPWFTKKYSTILSNLTRHAIIDFDSDNQVRCYPHVIVGLRSHGDLGIYPNRSPQNYTMMDFRLFVRQAYGLAAPEVGIPYRADRDDPDKKPRVMLIDRGKTRRFVNAAYIIQGLEWFGFEVVMVNQNKTDSSSLDEFAQLVDSCDAIMGAHGAGLTNMVFLRSGGVVVHVVPHGVEFMADAFYGAPARDMGLRHVKYSISPEESTLLEKYGWNHTVIKDPEAVRSSGGLEKVGEVYMSEQDIVLNMTRFGPILLKAIDFIM
ncbi:beta-1,2-xylosyltransferase XYXT1 isoform X2 [Lolium perenne]|uniref:beta-1,2-xylosyltransferase XYXT1 isoform X2 n=1 Tax=Lolium perenne TaxID=4522 RepID=UPI0021F64FBA|nr:beta-1,2-xylosyltransferase XYXT1-like isoform X2 [Lolium perenne]